MEAIKIGFRVNIWLINRDLGGSGLGLGLGTAPTQ